MFLQLISVDFKETQLTPFDEFKEPQPMSPVAMLLVIISVAYVFFFTIKPPFNMVDAVENKDELSVAKLFCKTYKSFTMPYNVLGSDAEMPLWNNANSPHSKYA